MHTDTLKVRKLNFNFDEPLAFQSNPGNPGFGNVINSTSIIGPCFERYFIKAFRQAMPKIKNPQLLKEAEWFCAQEAQHARHHLTHIDALAKQYPGVKQIQEAVMASYTELFERESLEFHLAYTAFVELAFGPTAKFIIEQREPLLSQCDQRVASLILWHFVEEFEHRNCAIDVYNEVVGSYWFRLKAIPAVIKHFIDVGEIIQNGIDQSVPIDKNPFGHRNFSGMGKGISRMQIAHYFYHLFLSQMPLHKPDNLETPAWAVQWFKDEINGVDMTRYYP